MKTLLYNRLIVLSVLFLFTGIGVSPGQQLEKKIVKSFSVKPDTKIVIGNKFGTVHINTWNQNRVNVEIEIAVSAKNQKKTQELLNNINIDINDQIQAGYLEFQTQIRSSKGNVSFEVNYKVDMPEKNDLDLKNSFGNVYLQNLAGDANIEVKYGQLLAEDISGKSRILLTFGSGWNRIGELNDAKVTVKYSKVNIESANHLELDDQFSDARMGRVGTLDLKCKYGDIEIEEVDHLKGNGAFSGFEIGKLNGSISVEGKYGDGITIESISKNFTSIDITNEFSGVDLWFETGVRAQLDLRLSFGSFRTGKGEFTFTKVIKNQNSSEYEGYIVSQNAKSTVRIVTKYGNVRLNVRE